MKKLILALSILFISFARNAQSQTPPSTCVSGFIWYSSPPTNMFLCASTNTWFTYLEGSFSPTLVASAGTIPTFTTNQGIYTQIGRLISYSVYLNNTTGGTAGVGNQQISINLPFATSNNAIPIRVVVGTALNGSQELTIYGTYPVNGNTMLLWRFGSSTAIQALTNADLNNANIRQIMLTGNYIR